MHDVVPRTAAHRRNGRRKQHVFRASCATLSVVGASLLACADATLAPSAISTRVPAGAPAAVYEDLALESPPSAGGEASIQGLVTQTGAITASAGYFPTATVVHFDVHGVQILTGVKPEYGSGTYGLRGRTCQGGAYGGTTSFFGSASGGWDACTSTVSGAAQNYSDYTVVAGTVTIQHAGDDGKGTTLPPGCTGDCFYLAGTSSVTLTRVEAQLGLTASEAAPSGDGVYIVSPGSTLTFGWSVAPATVPSAGGDIKLGAIVKDSSWEVTRPNGRKLPCPYFPYAPFNYRYCQVRADSAITVSLTAITNGAWKSKSVQVIPRRNFLLSAPGDATERDTITFTPTLDGQVVNVSEWSWKPDNPHVIPEDGGSGWPSAQDPRKRDRAMSYSGTMVARLRYADGSVDSASAHVRVLVRCPTLIDTLDHPEVRDGIKRVFDLTTAGDSVTKPRERYFVVVRYPDGGYDVVAWPTMPGADQCSSPVPQIDTATLGGATLIATGHGHAYNKGKAYTCQSAGVVYAPSDGAGKADWGAMRAINRLLPAAVPHIIIDPDNVFVLRPEENAGDERRMYSASGQPKNKVPWHTTGCEWGRPK